jgi:hypothetical protein
MERSKVFLDRSQHCDPKYFNVVFALLQSHRTIVFAHTVIGRNPSNDPLDVGRDLSSRGHFQSAEGET